MTHYTADAAYVRYQYDDSEKLRIRAETHRLYSERPDDHADWLLGHLAARRGDTVGDVGCGYGWVHPALTAVGARVIGVDSSFGMVGEAAEQARREHLEVVVAQGDAQALPIADASCDRVLCSHVLFHVPDLHAALTEMRRVARPGGRVVMTTNAADHSQALYAIHADAARALGYTPIEPRGHFTLDDLDLVRSVFPTAERHVRPDAFVFRDAEAVLRFYATGRVEAIENRPGDGSHRPALLAAVGERVATILARDGVFRVPKNAGCFIATVQ